MTNNPMSPGRRTPATADLCDLDTAGMQVCDLPLHQYGARPAFQGSAVTLRCVEDNSFVRSIVSEPGTGMVLVVDGGGSLRRALMGDRFAALAIENGWEGVIINGAVRDSALLAQFDLGVKALGTHPRSGSKTGAGERGVDLEFGGSVFTPGAHIVSDEDGVVILPAP